LVSRWFANRAISPERTAGSRYLRDVPDDNSTGDRAPPSAGEGVSPAPEETAGPAANTSQPADPAAQPRAVDEAAASADPAPNRPVGDVAPQLPQAPQAPGSDAASSPPRIATSSRGRRAAIVAAAGLSALICVAVLAIARRPHTRPSGSASGSPTGAAAIRAPEGPALPGGAPTGVRLTGFVVDGAGLPVAGAEVSAELERGAADRALAPIGSAGSNIGSNAGSNTGSSAESIAPSTGPSTGRAAAPSIIVAPPTGADGRFVLDGLVAGRFRLHVVGPGLLPADVRYVPVPSDEARIVVARQVAIEGSVTDGGKPVANAPVGLRGDAIGGTIETRTDATGGFRFARLPEGRYQLFAWQAALAARTIRVARLGAGPFGPVELRLEAASIVVGRVIDRDEGTGLAAAIELRPSGDDQAPRYARSGDDGVFRIEGVPNGRWIADAFVPGYLSTGGVELEAGHGVPELALTRGGAIEGRVLDGDGHPVAGAVVRSLTAGQNPTEISAEVDRDKLRRFSGRTAAPVPIAAPIQGGDPELMARGELGVLVGPIPPIPPPGAHVAQTAVVIDPSLAGEPPALAVDPARAPIWTTGADGVYRIRGFARAQVTVLATAAGFAEARGRRVAIEPGQLVTGIDLILTPGTLVAGKVTDQHGTPVTGAQITATPVGADAHDVAGAAIAVFTDDAGEYKLGPVTGTVELHATAYGHGEAKRTIALAAVRGLAPGERREDLVLVVADAVVAGILEDATGAAVAGAQLDVVGGVGDGRRAIAAADGTFSIDRLPAGPLHLHIAHPAYPSDDVEVIAGADNQARIRLHLALGGGIEGVLLDASSGAAIPSVSLAASGPANALAEASTDQAGRWKLGPVKPGRWRVVVKLPGYLAQTRELDVPVAHTPGGTSVRDIRIELARGALLGGTARDGRGQRIAGAHIVAAAITNPGQTCEADTDGQGEFRIHDCPTGEVDVVAGKAGLRGTARTTVRPGDEILSLALELR
jgi:hypothetical protein